MSVSKPNPLELTLWVKSVNKLFPIMCLYQTGQIVTVTGNIQSCRDVEHNKWKMGVVCDLHKSVGLCLTPVFFMFSITTSMFLLWLLPLILLAWLHHLTHPLYIPSTVSPQHMFLSNLILNLLHLSSSTDLLVSNPVNESMWNIISPALGTCRSILTSKSWTLNKSSERSVVGLGTSLSFCGGCP